MSISDRAEKCKTAKEKTIPGETIRLRFSCGRKEVKIPPHLNNSSHACRGMGACVARACVSKYFRIPPLKEKEKLWFHSFSRFSEHMNPFANSSFRKSNRLLVWEKRINERREGTAICEALFDRSKAIHTRHGDLECLSAHFRTPLFPSQTPAIPCTCVTSSSSSSSLMVKIFHALFADEKMIDSICGFSARKNGTF